MNYRRPRTPRQSRTRFDVAIRQRRATQASRAGLLSGVPGWLRTLVVVLIVLGGAAFVGVNWFMGSAWRVHAIAVRYNSSVPIDRILAASGLQGEHTQMVDLDAAAQRINDLPGIEGVRMMCAWSGECDIAIREAAPIAVWQTSERKVWVDGERKVQQLAPSGAAQAGARAPIAVQVEAGELPSIETPLDARLMRALTELQTVQPAVKQYFYTPEYGLMFNTAHGWRVRLGVSDYDGAMTDKLATLTKLEALLLTRGTAVRVVDVRFPQTPYYLQ